MVDRDSKALGLLLADTSTLQLAKGEAATLTDLGVVADGGAADRGAEGLEGADTKGRGLGLARLTPAGLAAGLVEPGADAALCCDNGGDDERGARRQGRARKGRAGNLQSALILVWPRPSPAAP